MDKFKNKYRIPSARLKEYDYGQIGTYFITICTQNREHFFGEIVDSAVQLNEIGQLAENLWLEIPQHFPFVDLGNFVIMPNHTHGILIIDKMDNDNHKVETQSINVQTRLIASLPIATLPIQIPQPLKIGGITGIKNPMFHENISRIIRWYKGRCSYEMRKIQADFAWQPRFHDHVIRSTQSFERIQTYIENNPLNWKEDKFYE